MEERFRRVRINSVGDCHSSKDTDTNWKWLCEDMAGSSQGRQNGFVTPLDSLHGLLLGAALRSSSGRSGGQVVTQTCICTHTHTHTPLPQL